MTKRERFKLSVSVFVIARRGQDILMLRRSGTGWLDGYFSLPAGGHDGDETVLAAARRELVEETGLLVDEDELELVHTLHCRMGDKGDEWIGLFYECRDPVGEPTLCEPDKHDVLAWVAMDDLPENIIPYVRSSLSAIADNRSFSTYGWS